MFNQIKKLKAKSSKLKATRGVASLPAIVLFGGIIIEIGIAGILLIYYLNNSLYGTRLSNDALVAAQAGIDDAILRIILDKTYSTYPDDYTLTVENATVDVTICKDTCAGSGKTEVTAIGYAYTKQHKIVAVLDVDSTTGLVTKDSVTEVAL